MNFFKLAILTLTAAVSLSVFAQDNDLSMLRRCKSEPVAPLPDGVELNKYKLLLTVGADEELLLNPITIGTQGFTTIFDLNAVQIETMRQAAITWIYDRYGINFAGGTLDPITGITQILTPYFAELVPINFEGTYRVLSSNNHHIPPYGHHNPTLIRLTEYTAVFPVTAPTYFGTYGGVAGIVGSTSDTVSYGIYKIFLDKHQKHGYNFFTRSYYPSITEPIAGVVPRSVERFQLYSSKWGPGFGFLNVGVATAPIDGFYPTFLRGSWSFPGSFVLPDYDTFTTPPLILD